MSGDSGPAAVSLIITFIYAFFGIAILAFCIDLIQEEILIKFSKSNQIFSSKLKVNRNVVLNARENITVENYEVVYENIGSKGSNIESHLNQINLSSNAQVRNGRINSNNRMTPINNIN